MGIEVIFPLTLTLSPGERGQQFGDFCLSQMNRVAARCRFARKLGTILPLPRGEGRGEGRAMGDFSMAFAVQPGLRNINYGH